jgi:hypothetical protein
MSDKKTRPIPGKGHPPEELPEIDPEDVFVVDDIPSQEHSSNPNYGMDSFAAPPNDPEIETELPPEQDKGPSRPIISRDKGPDVPHPNDENANPKPTLPGFTPPVTSSEALEADIEWPGGVPSLETIPTVVKPSEQDKTTSIETSIVDSDPGSDPVLTPNEPMQESSFPPPDSAATEEPAPMAEPAPDERPSYMDMDFGELPPGVEPVNPEGSPEKSITMAEPAQKKEPTPMAEPAPYERPSSMDIDFGELPPGVEPVNPEEPPEELPEYPPEHLPEEPEKEPVSFAAEEVDPSPRSRAIDFDLDDLAPPGMDIGPLSEIDFDAPAPNSDSKKHQGEAASFDSSPSPGSLGVRIEAPSVPVKSVEESPNYQPFEDIEHDLGSPEDTPAPPKGTAEDEVIEREAAALLDAIRLPENGLSSQPAQETPETLSSPSPSREEPVPASSLPEEDSGDTFTAEDIGESAPPSKIPPETPLEEPEALASLPEETETAASPPPAMETDDISDHGEEEEEEEEETEGGEEELSGWPIESPRSFPDFVFDRGGEMLLSVSGNTVDEFKELTERKGFLRYIVDYPEAMVLDVQEFPGDAKYAPVLTRKRLEEQGELTSDGQLVIYSAKKSGQNMFKALYQVVPSQAHATVLKRYNTYPHGFVIFDTVALLRGLLLKLDKKKTHALAIHCPEAVILLVGKGEDILLARRYALMGDDQAQLDEGLTTLQRDIETAENLDGEVENLVWVEPFLENTDIPPPETQLPLTPWPLTRLQKGDEAVFSALPGIIKRLPMTSSLGPKEETWLRPLETAEKWLWALLLIGILACAGSWYVFTSLKDSARLETTDIQHRIKELERRLPEPQNFQSEQIEPSLELAKKINQAVLAPPPAVLWNELAEATPSSLHIGKVIMAYGEDQVQTSLTGEIRLGLVEAQAVFIEFLSRLEQADFEVDTQKLLLDIQGNTFSVKLTKAYE